MKKTEPEGDGWSRHQAEQRQAWLRLSHLERLRWLDGAKRFVAAISKKTPTDSDGPGRRGDR